MTCGVIMSPHVILWPPPPPPQVMTSFMNSPLLESRITDEQVLLASISIAILVVSFLSNSKDNCITLKVVFDPHEMKNARQIFYDPSGHKGFLHFLNDPVAR